jgi:hypothetical protein
VELSGIEKRDSTLKSTAMVYRSLTHVNYAFVTQVTVAKSPRSLVGSPVQAMFMRCSHGPGSTRLGLADGGTDWADSPGVDLPKFAGSMKARASQSDMVKSRHPSRT